MNKRKRLIKAILHYSLSIKKAATSNEGRLFNELGGINRQNPQQLLLFSSAL